ncbi:LPS export ABC transporter periplasmic protein LptC [Thalassospira sp. TSL5-1]|uniref:LPS export ABC transporter periplasmic protein LptC n=1 Tax=Thalassospira sp. TSL5-1 TaxID=1544451 RepID=UPI0009FA7ABE|nr:LPS export ABC transporter periplasmic protein LptC [Thalassospira sp. TSL5-1]
MSADKSDTPSPQAPRTPGPRSRDRLSETRRDVRINPFRRSIVLMLKLMLPLIAAGLLALVVLWPQIEQVQESGFHLGFSSSPDDLMENVAMSNPRFFGVDTKRQPFTVTATEAIEQRKDGEGAMEHVMLEQPQADMTMTDGSWVALTANKGFYTESKSRLDLNGAVNMYHDKGFEIHTNSAEIKLKDGNASGTEPVDGQGPFGTIKSDSGFELENKGSVIHFLGKSKLKVFEKALKGKS